MQLNEVVFSDAQPVDGYGEGFFRIGGVVYNGSIITSGAGTKLWSGYQGRADLLEFAGKIDVLFIGTGAEISQIPSELREQLEAVGIGVEIMNSPAACRTYNVLLSEGRRIALAALSV